MVINLTFLLNVVEGSKRPKVWKLQCRVCTFSTVIWPGLPSPLSPGFVSGSYSWFYSHTIHSAPLWESATEKEITMSLSAHTEQTSLLIMDPLLVPLWTSLCCETQALEKQRLATAISPSLNYAFSFNWVSAMAAVLWGDRGGMSAQILAYE